MGENSKYAFAVLAVQDAITSGFPILRQLRDNGNLEQELVDLLAIAEEQYKHVLGGLAAPSTPDAILAVKISGVEATEKWKIINLLKQLV